MLKQNKTRLKSLIESLDINRNPHSKSARQNEKIMKKVLLVAPFGIISGLGLFFSWAFVIFPLAFNAEPSKTALISLVSFFSIFFISGLINHRLSKPLKACNELDAREIFSVFSNYERLTDFFKCLASYPSIVEKKDLKKDFQQLYTYIQEKNELEFASLMNNYFTLFFEAYKNEEKFEDCDKIMEEYNLVLPHKAKASDINNLSTNTQSSSPNHILPPSHAEINFDLERSAWNKNFDSSTAEPNNTVDNQRPLLNTVQREQELSLNEQSVLISNPKSFSYAK